ncbi:MAG TPA: DUF1315 family protein [Pseudomonadales bacterium]|nr:DUF1315 family protein [Pseudomonadales bacterium]
MTDTPDLHSLLENLSPEIYEALKRAVELGKWPNGTHLSSEQRELCLEAVIVYDSRHKPEQERIGYIHRDDHEHCGSDGDKNHDHKGNRWNEEQLLVFRDMQSRNPTRH